MTSVGVLVCDHLPEPMQRVAGGDIGDIYRSLLSTADPTLHIRSFFPVDGELPRPAECDAWVLTGSRADAHGNEPWVVALRGWIPAATEAGSRIAGVCFGHQLVAQALGGRVERAEGWRVGPLPMTVEPTPWFDAATVMVNAMHRDEVTVLPAGARVIATGPTAAVPAYVIGDTILCVQDHPEFTNDVVAALIEARAERLGAEVAADGLRRVHAFATAADSERIGRWLADFLSDKRR